MSGLKANWQRALQDLFNGRVSASVVQDDSFHVLLNSIFAGDGKAESLGLFEIVYSFMIQNSANPALQEISKRLRSIPTSLTEDQIDRGNVIKFITLAFIAALYEKLEREWFFKSQLSEAMAMLYKRMLSIKNREEDKEEEEEYQTEVKFRRMQNQLVKESHQRDLVVITTGLAEAINDGLSTKLGKPLNPPITAADITSVLNRLVSDFGNEPTKHVQQFDRAAGPRGRRS